MQLEPIYLNTIVNERYEIIKILGQGGFGRTYLAHDLQRFEELCVLKEFCPSSTGEYVVTKSRELFHREAAVLYKLKHPQIPTFRAKFEENDRLFLVQDYIEGKTYGKLLDRRRSEGRAFSEAEVLQWLRDLLPVLDYIHNQDIIHRDISPDNIMLPDGKNQPILIDFGVVKQALTEISGARGGSGNVSMLGKWGYSPHEQLRMGQCYPNSDLYSLAVTTLVLLTGKQPDELFDGHALEWRWRHAVQVSDELAAVLTKMLSDKPCDRYQSVTDVLAVLPKAIPSAIPTTYIDPNIDPNPDSTQVQNKTCVKSAVVHSNPPSPPVVSQPPTLPIDATPPPNSAPPEPSPVLASAQTPSPLAQNPQEQPIEAQPVSVVPQSAPVAEPVSATEAQHFLSRLKNPQFIGLSIAAVVILLVGGVVFDALATTHRSTQQKYQTLYDTANKRITAVKTLSGNPQNPEDVQDLRNRLNQAVSELESIPQDAQIYAQAQQALSESRNQLQSLDGKQKDVAAQQKGKEETQKKLAAAQKLAAEAQKQMKSAQTAEELQAARDLWRKALNEVKSIKTDGSIASTVKERSQTYEKQIEEIDAEIRQLQTPSPQNSAPEPAPAPVSAPEPDYEPPSTPVSAPEPEAHYEAAPAPEPEAHYEAAPAPEPEPYYEAAPAPEPEPYYEAAPAPEPEAHYEAAPAPEPEAHYEAAPAPEPEPYYEAAPAPVSAPEPEPYYEAAPAPEPEPYYEAAPAPAPEYHEPAPSYAPAPSKSGGGDSTPLW